VSHCNEDDFLDQRVLESIDGVIDERAAIVERNNADILRKSGTDLGDLLFYGIDDLKSVRPVASNDYPADRFLATFVEDSRDPPGSEPTSSG